MNRRDDTDYGTNMMYNWKEKPADYKSKMSEICKKN